MSEWDNEDQLGTTTTRWFMDVVEYADGINPSNAFSVPVVFNDNQKYTLGAFQDKINDAFQLATTVPLTLHEYVLKIADLSMLLPDAEFDPTAPIELALQYHVYPADLVGPLGPVQSGYLDAEDSFRFKINFYSGPHGFNEIDRPPSLAALGGDFDSVLPLSKIQYETEVSPQLVVAPGFNARALMMSKPPVRPDVQFMPIIGSRSTMKIFLNGMVGDYEERPIILGAMDKSNFAGQYIAQQLTALPTWDAIVAALEEENSPQLGPIRFTSDDPVQQFQIFRTRERPSAYTNFAGTGRTFKPVVAYGKGASSGITTEQITPNTTYYYCFRAMDTHGNVSNPTHVYQIELVDNDGQRFLTQKIVEFEDYITPYLQVKKTGHKMIYIEPSESNLQLDAEAYKEFTPEDNISPFEAPAANILGTQHPDNCWDKIFKIRVTSRKTGKKFDINVTFKNTGVHNP